MYQNYFDNTIIAMKYEVQIISCELYTMTFYCLVVSHSIVLFHIVAILLRFVYLLMYCNLYTYFISGFRSRYFIQRFAVIYGVSTRAAKSLANQCVCFI